MCRSVYVMVMRGYSAYLDCDTVLRGKVMGCSINDTPQKAQPCAIPPHLSHRAKIS